jgi:chromosome partitioning protein
MSAKVLTIACQKGGVGKTTVTMNLAAVANESLAPGRLHLAGAASPADDRSPVCVCSTDPQASSAFWSRRIEKREAGGLPFDFIQLDDPVGIAKLKNHYRIILVDTPGSIDDEHLLLETLQQTDEVLVPILPEGLSFEPTARTIEHVIEAMGLPFRVVVNGWDPRDGEKDLTDTARYIRRKGWPVCNTVVRRYKIHTRAAVTGQVVTQYAKNRVAMEARSDFYQLALELGIGGSIGAAAIVPAPASPTEAMTLDSVEA